jgi:hypothetical protein
MSYWAGLVVDRNNLPCVGQPLDLYPEYNDTWVDPTPVSIPPMLAPAGRTGDSRGPKPTLKQGDVVGSWLLVEFRPGGWDEDKSKRYRPHWYCKCQCGCNEERWVRAENLTQGKSKHCTRGVKKGQRLNRNSAV